METDSVNKSQAKKQARKSARLEANLSKKRGFKFSTQPTLTLLLGNAGLHNDVPREILEHSISDITYIDLIMSPEETFAVLLFDDLSVAKKAKDRLSGARIETPDVQARTSVVIYPLFITDSCDFNVSHLGGANMVQQNLPPGLRLIEAFVSDSEGLLLEQSVLSNHVDTEYSSTLKQRQVFHFGYEFLYGKNTVDPDSPLIDRPIPPACYSLIDRLLSTDAISSRPDQLTVNIYEPGHGIPPHVDTHSPFGDELVSVSLDSASVMQFTNPRSPGATRAVHLPAGSVLVMTGEARYLWNHCIPARRWDLVLDEGGRWTKRLRDRRLSLTFRTLRRPPVCQCVWPEQCDTAQQSKKNGYDDSGDSNTGSSSIALLNDPVALEKLHVHQVYEDIAGHFSDTRHSVWPSVERFLLSLPDGALVIDAGCGNGKYLAVNKNLLPILACDRSFNLCAICHNRGHDVIQADMLSLPYRTSIADYVICIAVLHHLSTEDRRHAALLELARLLRPAGRLLVHVWALEQERNGQPANYLKKRIATTAIGDPASGSESDREVLPVHVNRTKFREKDMLVPWHKKAASGGGGSGSKVEEIHHRYYHLFSEGELEKVCGDTGLFNTVESYYDKGNWCVIVEKVNQ